MKSFLLLFILPLLIGLTACNKVVDPDTTVDESAPFTFIVTDTQIAVMPLSSGDTLFNQLAYRLRIVESGGRNPLTAEPVIYEFYKNYPGSATANLMARLFGGGAGYSAGDTVYYTDDRGFTTPLVYRNSLDTLLISGTENRNEYRFAAAARSRMVVSGRGRLSAGFRDRLIEDPLLRGGSISSFFDINNNEPYTVTPWVRVSARINVAGLSSLSYVRYSKILPVTFGQILAMDSLLRNAGRLDTHTVNIGDGYRFRLGDSALINVYSVPVGRFGGLFRIPRDSFPAFFDSVHYLSQAEARGDTGWVYLSRKDTLLPGAGSKWVYLNHKDWQLPYTDSIGIRPWNMEVGIDLARAGNRVSQNYFGVNVTSDDIPFEVKTFGDTSFDNEVSIWIATRNIYPLFMISGKFSNGLINNAIGMMEGVEWPDAVLETPPRSYRLNQGYLSNLYTPDYDNGYRVSPLVHLFLYPGNMSIGKEYVENVSKIIRQNPRYLGTQMARGSILGYSETHLDDFNHQDSLFADTLDRLPGTGWFTIRPVASVAPDSLFKGDSALARLLGARSPSEMIPKPPEGDLPGRKYFSVFSGYYLGPNDNVAAPMSALKLYRNPMRSVPYFVKANVLGSKEFVICVYGRGRFFGEPRAAISSNSGAGLIMWDKIPPHVEWDTTANTMSSHYAPTYSVLEGGKRSDLSKTEIPYVFNVNAAIVDMGGSRLTRIRLMFNYSADLQSVNPETGERTYRNKSFSYEIGSERLAGWTGANVVFRNIDSRLWQSGLWDMWFETEDDLQNKGVAPLLLTSTGYDPLSGAMSVRKILR